ncbi:hypothetical protein [Leptolyngbya sp. PCC 6406]|uniref:hypothetical protein n=1 Tax=Leptolyngbya sp. PCC 6406 TaxID=1173264 RepID=UPI0002AC1756|nr:hypothetical protein [Leptolyngbya sp. PCC 6406]
MFSAAATTAIALTLGTALSGGLSTPQLAPSQLASNQLAQNQDPYQDWIYLYTNTFENSQGSTIDQQWWLNPSINREGDIVRFTLLSRRTPISDNGTAAGVFDYIANCEALSYAVEQMTFLDTADQPLQSQTQQTPLRDAEASNPLYPHLQDICAGVYGS